ncbi:NAD(P)H-hydrate dehydratase [Acidianus manzaensis]|uniref:Bifunctional NAD(P)H-hydrate repair enzyme n=1 Tax=Acidianus manzaensis TaxID=282676 RepID=A0A1W6JXJ9_9CREN|nr:NAD(P)H-hydrate dehydratase [Acidianus manzaensis]ARM74998.1 bifunctional ADP-dependent NAD(P)H-hydrate dehydratase/NAD(P)H-hydrate epimerase [Acidianus manzaensis]
MITSKRMRILEINSEAFGVPTLLLMENAGRSVKDEILKELKDIKDKTVCIFAGHGGKGGDGLVAARHLASEGAKVNVLLLGENKHKDAISNLLAVQNLDYTIYLKAIKDVEELSPLECDILIDAMLGTGFSGKPREPFRTAINVFNRSKGFKVSIDVPSGIDSDTGEAPGEYVIPDIIVTFHELKQGLSKFNNVKVYKIGIPIEAEIYVGPGDVLMNIKKRDMKSKKGAGGRVLVIGGSYTFSGAPALSGLAALRTGADLVYVASPDKTSFTIASYSPDLIAIKLSGDNINPANFEELKPWIDRVNSVVIGPGMGLNPETKEASKLIVNYLKETNKPSVIDADALKSISGYELYPNAVITPHAGEFKIFFNEEPKTDNKERIQQVIEKAKQAKCVVLLKGYFDIISDGVQFKLNKSGNPGMTVGGTGDTLTGIIATLLAQKLTPLDSASIGAFINGLAGSLAYQKYGNHIVPTDLINEIPNVINDPLENFKKRVYDKVLY